MNANIANNAQLKRDKAVPQAVFLIAPGGSTALDRQNQSERMEIANTLPRREPSRTNTAFLFQ